VAAKFAIEDANLMIGESNTNRTGVVLGTTLGSVYSISEFDKTALREGPRAVNPALFPNTVINSPASQISIRFVIKGFNTTIATGFTASLDALRYAYDFIQFNRADAVVVGGVEELCIQIYLGFYKLKFLAGSKGLPIDLELSCPFDKRRNGIVFGEGAAMVVIEPLEKALQRNARIYAEILSFGYCFDPFRINKYNRLGPGIRTAMRRALENANLKPGDIDYISANANSVKEPDLIEVEAIKDVFGEDAKKVPVSSIKSMVGESFSACGALSLASSVGAIENKFIPPTLNYSEADPECDLDFVPNKSRKKELKNVLVNTFGPSGTNTCAVIAKYDRN
jgi:3-oxoacyl-[acyl-carrier-protein] synthase II